ncbi:MAG: hypothetical protein K0Q49_401 [Haloplasmataceae bacterium]|jgi:RNA-directed DNA polymerase|nr:hypothetical protein [Haloplasmataceae bacterium]
MRILYLTIDDGDVLSLIREYLVSGVMINGVVIVLEEGTQQGGPLRPLLANIILNELDRELTNRVLRFVKSIPASERVLESVTKFIDENLKLKVNRSKSKVDFYN